MRSMTGCGKCCKADDGWEATVEIRSVNHRFLDVSCRLPRNLAFLEDTVRKGISAGIRRGHVDVFVTVKRLSAGTSEIKTDLALAQSYVDASEELLKNVMHHSGKKLKVSELMCMEGVLQITESAMDEDRVSALCREAVEGAVKQLDDMRIREGEVLQSDLAEHLEAAAAIRRMILERAPRVVEDYRSRLQARLDRVLTEPIDPARLAQEVALMADKCAVDEELSRLESHIRQMRVYLKAEGEVGKKMDFLIQEMNREANTIGSKASDAEIAQMVVDLKSEIEKMREQVQNAE